MSLLRIRLCQRYADQSGMSLSCPLHNSQASAHLDPWISPYLDQTIFPHSAVLLFFFLLMIGVALVEVVLGQVCHV